MRNFISNIIIHLLSAERIKYDISGLDREDV